jgi:hypothetical protein
MNHQNLVLLRNLDVVLMDTECRGAWCEACGV